MEYPNHKMSCKIPVEEWRLPTAEEKLRLHYHGFSDDQFNEFISKFPGIEIKYAMIEFAKLHVQEALKVASENAALDYWKGDCQLCGSNTIDKDSILNAYPLDQIK
jgi:hypothetical protein